MVTLVLPQLVAGRDLADAMLDSLQGGLRGQDVVIDARGLTNGSASFASQLVRRALVTDEASSLVMVGAPRRFAEYTAEAARALGVAGRLDLCDDAPGHESQALTA